jgi:hypothetical protein
MKTLLVKFPTRSRPDKFKNVLQKYINHLSGTVHVRFVITMDNDDDTMNTQDMREWLDGLIDRGIDLVYHYGDSKTKIEAVNADLEGENADVLLLASDDMIPEMFGYDAIIMQSMEEAWPEFDGAIKFNDGLRNDPLMTLCVMGWKLYEKFGYIYHPDYKYLYCDTEQTEVCIALEKFAVSPMCIIRHQWLPGEHPEADELHKMHESGESYQRDLKVYNERKQNNFYIEEMV